MATPLAKISAPVPAEIVERARLYRSLDAAFQRPVTWIGGPGGCGKTTLIASYVKARCCRCLWYQVDAGDADPGSLFHFLSLACEQADPTSLKEPPPSFGPEQLPGIAVFARRYFRDIFGRFEAPFVLVFDNLNEAPPDAPLYDVLRAAAAEIPRGGHMALLSRSEPHAVLARSIATREMTQLTWDDLRFSDDEALALVELLGKGKRERQDISRIMELSKGWAAGLLLLTTAEENGAVEERYSRRAVGETLFDYFAAEVFDRIDASRQDLLLRTAFLPKVSSGMARDLTGDPHAERNLDDFARRNFFTVRRPPGDIYGYHPLFREFLHKRAAATYTTHELAAVKRSAALSLARNGQVGDAVRLVIELHDWDELARLVDTHAPEFLGQTRHGTVQSWLEALPRAVLDEKPWLHYWLGLSRAPFKPMEAQASLEHAYRLFRRENSAPGAFLAWTAIVDLLTDFNVYGPQLDTWLDEFEDLIRKHPTYPSKEIECRVAVSIHIGLEYARPWHRELRQWAHRASTLAEEMGHTEVQLRVSFNRLQSLIFSPEDPERALVIDKLQHLVARPGISALGRIRAQFAFAGVATFDGRFEEGVTFARQALEHAEREGIAAVTPVTLYMLARAHQGKGDLETGRSHESYTRPRSWAR